ncbi:hypothetical protein GCM10025859_62950 [Alicyclobacillus fastidiosus]|nr:hypothetical protein GCM10025859_62950 [Alicyclobacillus fastidiosus]
MSGSATIGESRRQSIIAVLKGLFFGFELSDDQPEGVYTKSGTYEQRTQLIRKIERSQLTPLYKKTYRDMEFLVCLYQNHLVESYDYGMDYIDEKGTKYRIMRMVTGFEKVNRFLLSVEEYRDGYRAFHQATERKETSIEVLHPLVEAMPPELSVGTVVYDTEERCYARIIEVDQELHLQHESSAGKSSWEPFILSSRYEVVQDTPFEVPTSGLYFDTTNRYLYRAVFERPNYLVVAPAHNGTFESRRWSVAKAKDRRPSQQSTIACLVFVCKNLVGDGYAVYTAKAHVTRYAKGAV